MILAGALQSAQAAQRATETIPIVLANVSEARGNKLIASLARPGGNITGITSLAVEVFGKLIEIFHEAVPHAKRVAVLLSESSAAHTAYWDAAVRACETLRIVPIRIATATGLPEQFEAAATKSVEGRAQGVVVAPDPAYLFARVKLQEILDATGHACGLRVSGTCAGRWPA